MTVADLAMSNNVTKNETFWGGQLKDTTRAKAAEVFLICLHHYRFDDHLSISQD